jgi:hypothetical protein
MYNKQCEWNSIVNATEIDLKVYRRDTTHITVKLSLDEQNSMFDQMTTFFEFEKWGSVRLCGKKTDVCLKESSSDIESIREHTKESINGGGRNLIRMQQQKGELLHFEIQESVPARFIWR